MKKLLLTTLSAAFILLPMNTSAEEPTEKAVTHIDAPASEKLLTEKEAPAVIDLRTPEEFKEGHIVKAENIDFLAEDFEKNLAKLDKDKTYIVHCQSGGRSNKALATFEKLGFKHIYHLDGGYSAWLESQKVDTKK